MGKKKNRHFPLLGFSRVIMSFRSCRSPNVGDSHSLSTPYISSPPPSPTNQYQHPQNFPDVPVVSCSRCNCRSFSRAKTPDRKCDGNVTSVEVIPAYLWRKEDKWHVVVDDPNKPTDLLFSPQRSKIDSDNGGDLFPPLSIPKPSYRKSKKAMKNKNVKKNGRNNNKKKKTSSRGRASTSSADTRLFSSDEDEDREFEEEYEFEDDETPIYSSNSLSTVVDGHYNHNRTRRLSTESSSSSSMSSMFLRRMKRIISSSSSCAAGGGNVKVRDSFAVVKRSNDPYSDFRRSMLEMVIEKQIYEASDLEDLLRCFLSLNSDEHHKTIIRAFSNVRDGFFRS